MGFLFGFLLFHSIVFLCFFFPFFFNLEKTFTHHEWMNERKMNIDCDGYVLGFLFVDSISVEHSSLGFKAWNGEVCITYSDVWLHVEEKTLFGLLKSNMDSQINFFFVLIQKTCSSKGLRVFMVHFDTFVKNWVHIWKYNIQLWKIQFWWKIGLQCLLMWLGNGNGLQLMGDLFGVSKGIILVIMREFCQMVRLHLQKLFVQFSNEP